MKKQIGIWIDEKEAIIITLDGNNAHVTQVKSGSTTNLKKDYREGNQPHTEVHSPAAANRDLTLKTIDHVTNFQKEIFEKISAGDEWYLFGPGEMKHNLEHYLKEYHASEFLKIKGIQNAGHITSKEMIVQVNDFFATI